jgi:hypothetical protein
MCLDSVIKKLIKENPEMLLELLKHVRSNEEYTSLCHIVHEIVDEYFKKENKEGVKLVSKLLNLIFEKKKNECKFSLKFENEILEIVNHLNKEDVEGLSFISEYYMKTYPDSYNSYIKYLVINKFDKFIEMFNQLVKHCQTTVSAKKVLINPTKYNVILLLFKTLLELVNKEEIKLNEINNQVLNLFSTVYGLSEVVDYFKIVNKIANNSTNPEILKFESNLIFDIVNDKNLLDRFINRKEISLLAKICNSFDFCLIFNKLVKIDVKLAHDFFMSIANNTKNNCSPESQVGKMLNDIYENDLICIFYEFNEKFYIHLNINNCKYFTQIMTIMFKKIGFSVLDLDHGMNITQELEYVKMIANIDKGLSHEEMIEGVKKYPWVLQNSSFKLLLKERYDTSDLNTIASRKEANEILYWIYKIRPQMFEKGMYFEDFDEIFRKIKI